MIPGTMHFRFAMGSAMALTVALSQAAVHDSGTQITMRNVAFHVAPSVVLHVRSLDGMMHGIRDSIVDFDDARSYIIDVDRAEVGLTGSDLTHLMNEHVFAYPGAPLRHIRVDLANGQLRMRGTLHKGVDIPFDINADVVLQPNGDLRLHPVRIRIFGVNGELLMRALHLTLASMLDLSKAKGITVHGNDLVLDPLAILPPPVIHGRVSSVRIAGSELVQTFGAPGADVTPAAIPDTSARNYMYYRGGTLHFGKLYMSNAEMLIMDMDPSDPFDFDNEHYQRQLIAGYSRTLPDLGLEVFMPDARRLAPPHTSPAP